MANYLVDTHIFIWINQEQAKIPSNIREILSNRKHKFYLSIASIWEMQIKIQLNKLTIHPNLPDVLKKLHEDNVFQILPITETHILNLQQLPFIHKDPFDRLLISQAMTENLTILTVDEHIVKYPIFFIS